MFTRAVAGQFSRVQIFSLARCFRPIDDFQLFDAGKRTIVGDQGRVPGPTARATSSCVHLRIPTPVLGSTIRYNLQRDHLVSRLFGLEDCSREIFTKRACCLRQSGAGSGFSRCPKRDQEPCPNAAAAGAEWLPTPLVERSRGLSGLSPFF